MKIITAIKNAPIVFDESDTHSIVDIEYNGKIYRGESHLHPLDKDFISEKVGKNIALMRARIKLLEDEYKKSIEESKIKEQFYIEIHSCLNEKADSIAQDNLKRSLYRTKILRIELKSQKRELKNYLRNQQSMIDKIQAIRARSKTDK